MTIQGFEPYDKQKEILRGIINGPEKYHCILTGRQVGKSLMLENLVYYYSINNKNSIVGLISPTWSQVSKIFDSILLNLEKTPLIKSKDKTRGIINLRNGSSIRAFSAERFDNLRGQTFTHLWLDEFAFFKADAWATAIKATTLVKAEKVCFFSTPTHKDSELYNIYQLGLGLDINYKSYHMSSWDNPFIDPEEFNEYRRSLPLNIYMNEIMGEFTDEGSGVFRNILDCCLLEPKPPRPNCFIGIDLGNKQDWSVISIIDGDGNQVGLVKLQEDNWNIIVDRIKDELRRWPRATIWAESNGVGSPIIDQLREEFEIREFFTTNDNKQDIIQNLIYKIDKGLPFLLDDDTLKTELNNFTYKYSKASGKIQYAARTGHDDTVMATAISYKCFNEGQWEMEIDFI